jgi:hypothetical protein
MAYHIGPFLMTIVLGNPGVYAYVDPAAARDGDKRCSAGSTTVQASNESVLALMPSHELPRHVMCISPVIE